MHESYYKKVQEIDRSRESGPPVQSFSARFICPLAQSKSGYLRYNARVVLTVPAGIMPKWLASLGGRRQPDAEVYGFHTNTYNWAGPDSYVLMEGLSMEFVKSTAERNGWKVEVAKGPHPEDKSKKTTSETIVQLWAWE